MRFGDFELLGLLGTSGDSVTWHGRRRDVLVALKSVRPDANDPLVGARLGQEASALARTSGWSVPIVDVGQVGNAPWLATRWCDAGDLGAWARDSGGLADEVIIAVMARVARALAAAHASDVVHRDVKPANILLTSAGDVWLGDFGYAAVEGVVYDSWDSEGSRARLVAHTEGLAAPEVLTEGSIDRSGDVFAFGRTVAQLRRAGATGLLDDLVDACTQHDSGERPTMSEVADRLDGPAPIAVRPPRCEPRIAPLQELVQRVGHGRDDELASLRTALEGALAVDETRIVLLQGAPGCGKTWLADEVLALLPAGLSVIRLRCSAAIADWRVLRPLVASVVSTVSSLGRAPLEALNQAVGLGNVGQPRPDYPTATIALRSLLKRVAPFIIAIDDLHHADAALLELLARLPGLGAPGLILATARPGVVDADDLDAATLVVGELDEATLHTIVQCVIDDPAQVAQAVRVAAGNPLHALEAARAFARGEVDLGDASLRELIATRSSSVASELAEALALAATCGEECWPTILGAGLRSAAPALVRDGWLAANLPSEVADASELRFAHPLLREVVYEQLADDDRCGLHRHIGDRLRSLPEPPVDRVADHYMRAFELGARDLDALAADAVGAAGRLALRRWAISEAERRLVQLRATRVADTNETDWLAAEVALRLGRYREAAEVADRSDSAIGVAIEAYTALGEHERTVGLADALGFDEQRFEMMIVRSVAESLGALGRRHDAVSLLTQQELLARASGDLVTAARLKAARAFQVSMAEMEQADEPAGRSAVTSREAVEELRSLGDSVGLVVAAVELGHALGDYDRDAALEILVIARDGARELGAGDQLVRVLSYLAGFAIDFANPRLVHDCLDEARALPRDAESAARLEIADHTVTAGHGDTRAIDSMIDAAERFGHGDSQAAVGARLQAWCALLWIGRLDDATRFADRFDFPAANAHMLHQATLGLAGPPWPEVEPDPEWGTLANNELALLRYLRVEQRAGDDLLRARHVHLTSTGSTYQRFNGFFPSALVAALGPEGTDPATDWLVEWILNPPLPWMWAVHRCICAALLAERRHPEARSMIDTSFRLLADIEPDDKVRAWLEARLLQSA